jgi:hypothetical protein
MAAKDLITLARAKDSLGGAQGSSNLTLSSDEATTLSDRENSFHPAPLSAVPLISARG